MSGRWLFVVVLILLLSGGASYLTLQFVKIQNSWSAKYETVAENEKKAEEALQKSAKLLDEKTHERNLLTHRWGKFWTEVNTVISGDDGSISLNAGTNQGVPAMNSGASKLLYGFQQDPDNPDNFKFVKAFQLTDVQLDRSSAKVQGFITPEELETWKPGLWTFFETIPVSESATLNDLGALDVQKNQLRNRQRAHRDKQIELVANAEEMLNSRIRELDGDSDLQEGENVPVEMVKGLIIAIEEAQNQQMELLQEVDELRRSNKNNSDEIMQLIEDNKKLDERSANLENSL